MAAITEYLPVIAKLLDRTKARKIEWKGTYESTTFICALEGEYSFEIEKRKFSGGNWFRSLTMKDKDGEMVFVAQAFAPDSETSIENDQLYTTLDELYEQARRIALDIDKKLTDVSEILDNI
jgi:hypothetical protein